MDEKVDKANSLADLVLKYGKIMAVLGVMIGVGFLTYNQIQYNSHQLTLHEEQFKELLQTMAREFEVQAQRSDKRYSRAMEEAEELHQYDHEHDDKLWDLSNRISHIEGSMSK